MPVSQSSRFSRGPTHRFGQTGRPTAKVQVAADIFVRATWGDLIGRVRRISRADFHELLNGLEALDVAFEQKDVLPRDADLLRRRQCHLHRRRQGQEEFGLGDLQRVTHLFDVVSWRRPVDPATCPSIKKRG